MNKAEFLTALRRKLTGLPKADLEDRVSFYEEMIDERVAEGKSEEEAVADIGTTDEAVKQIASETKLSHLVKEKIKPKKSFNAFQIVLIMLSFPVWFPLFVVGSVLIFVACLLLWVLMIVAYAIELAFVSAFVSGLAGFIASITDNAANMHLLGLSLVGLGGACLFIFVCIPATKLSIGLTKSILLSIKSKIIANGEK